MCDRCVFNPSAQAATHSNQKLLLFSYDHKFFFHMQQLWQWELGRRSTGQQMASYMSRATAKRIEQSGPPPRGSRLPTSMPQNTMLGIDNAEMVSWCMSQLWIFLAFPFKLLNTVIFAGHCIAGERVCVSWICSLVHEMQIPRHPRTIKVVLSRAVIYIIQSGWSMLPGCKPVLRYDIHF